MKKFYLLFVLFGMGLFVIACSNTDSRSDIVIGLYRGGN